MLFNMKCIYPRCRNESRARAGLKTVAFFRFPVRKVDRLLWLQFCGLAAEFRLPMALVVYAA